MRYPVRQAWGGVTPGSDLHLIEVESAMFRSFWFRSVGGPTTYALNAYLTKADAEAATGRVMQATHGPGASVVVPMAVSAGAAVDPTPTSVRLFAIGAWTDALLGWSDDVEMVLIDRMVRVFENYRATYEVLAEVEAIQIGHTMPEINFSVIGVTTGLSQPSQPFGANLWSGLIDVEVVVWTMDADPDVSKRRCSRLSGALRSICMDEQRTWGDFATETRLRGGVLVANEERGNAWLYEAIIPLTVQLAEARGQRTVGGAQSDGGKYTVGL